jgi:uncharacterized protein YbjQ (UPF0145 family)
MIITVSHAVQGHSIQKYMGLACGIALRVPDTSKKGLMDQIKGLADKAGIMTQICKEAREQSFQAMIKHAEGLGANAVIGVSFDNSKLMEGSLMQEICCYGTAVVVAPLQQAAKPVVVPSK